MMGSNIQDSLFDDMVQGKEPQICKWRLVKEGDFVNSKKIGKGTYYYNDSSRYSMTVRLMMFYNEMVFSHLQMEVLI